MAQVKMLISFRRGQAFTWELSESPSASEVLANLMQRKEMRKPQSKEGGKGGHATCLPQGWRKDTADQRGVLQRAALHS